MAQSLQSKQYIVSSRLERMHVRMQHMARGMSEDSAGLQTLASLRPARAGGGGQGWCKQAGAARRGSEERRWWGLPVDSSNSFSTLASDSE